MKKRIFSGSGTAIVTPFKDGSVDFSALKRIIDFQIQNNTKAIIVCGTTGEASTLTEEEQKKVIAFTINHTAKRIPVIAGTGSNSTSHAVSLSKFAAAEGADGLLAVTPYYNKTTQKGIKAHYFAIAEATNKPVIVYNVPSRTGLNILPETYMALGAHDNIVAIKEANSNIGALAETRMLTGDTLDVYCGNDNEVVPFLSLGSIGVISVLSNILPKEMSDICELFFEGKVKESAELQISVIELCGALFCETNPIPVKHAAKLIGLCSDELRLPLVAMEEKNRKRLFAAMQQLGLIS